MKKKIWIPLTILTVLILAAGIFLAGKSCMTGLYFADSSGHYLITDSPVHMWDKGSGQLFSHFNNGDSLLVLHGPLAESYPPQTQAYFCIKLKDGTAEDAKLAQEHMDRATPKPELPTEPTPTCDLPHPKVTVGRMVLAVPGDWHYTIDEETPAIRLWLGTDTEHTLVFKYCPQFGVCGTGLETVDVTLPSGLTGSMGTYDAKPYWSYIALEQGHVITMQCDGAWWAKYADRVMELVNSLELTQD